MTFLNNSPQLVPNTQRSGGLSLEGENPQPLLPNQLSSSGSSLDGFLQESIHLAHAEMVAFGQRDDVSMQMAASFGEDYKLDAADQFFDELLMGTGVLPKVKLVDDSVLAGNLGAYAASEDAIYLSRQLVEQAQDVGTIEPITDVLLEEFGHALDLRVNETDALGDEGEAFRNAVLGLENETDSSIFLNSSADDGTINVKGQSLAVEFSGRFTWGGKSYEWSRYRIRSGDTLSGIAQRTLGSGSYSAYMLIARKNGISNPSRISAGQSIYVPKAASSRPPVISPPVRPSNPRPTPPVGTPRPPSVPYAKPDLINQYSSATSRLKPGQTLSMRTTVTNRGNGSAGSSYLRYYLSNDTRLDSRDTLLGSDYVSSLRAGKSSAESLNVTYQSRWGTGSKYVLFVDDATKRVSESNEFNNVFAKRIFVDPATSTVPRPTVPPRPAAKPDLINQYSSATSRLKPGQTLSMRTTVTNRGNGSAGSSYLRYYLSNDTKLDSRDTLLGSDYVSSLRAGKSSAESLNVTYQSRWGTGSKYVLFVDDATKRVSESNESNNVFAKRIFVDRTVTPPRPATKPDLINQYSSATSRLKPGQTLSMKTTVTNRGNGSAGSSYLRYYLSSDTKLDSRDTLLGSDYVSSLRAGRGSAESLNVTYQSRWGTGTKYVLFAGDATKRVSESNESNNVFAKRIFVDRASSTPPRPTAPVSGSINSKQLNFNLANQSIGGGGAGRVIGGTFSDSRGFDKSFLGGRIKASAEVGYNLSAYATAGVFDVKLPSAFSLDWTLDKRKNEIDVNLSSKLFKPMELSTKAGLSLSAKANAKANVTVDIPIPFVDDFEAGVDISGGLDLASIQKAAKSPVVLDLDLQSKKRSSSSSVTAEDNAFQAIDIVNTLALIPATSIPARAAREAGVSAQIGANINQKSDFKISHFEIDFDGKRNGNEKILKLNESKRFSIPIPKWLQPGNNFTFSPTVRPISTFSTDFRLSGKAEASFTPKTFLESKIDKIGSFPGSGWVKDQIKGALPGVSFGGSLSTPSISVWSKTFDPFRLSSAKSLGRISVPLS